MGAFAHGEEHSGSIHKNRKHHQLSHCYTVVSLFRFPCPHSSTSFLEIATSQDSTQYSRYK